MQQKTWTVAEAKARLSEILRRAREEGPQRIGTRTPCVIVTEGLWTSMTQQRQPLGRWLADNLPRGVELAAPDRSEPRRRSPFEDEE